MNIALGAAVVLLVVAIGVTAMLTVRRRGPRRLVQRRRPGLGVFAGISVKLDNERLRAVLLGVGYAVFIGAVAWIATFPVSFAV